MVIWREGSMQVIRVQDGFIAQNTRKHWKEGHTHVRSKKRAIDLCRHAKEQNIPQHFDIRCLGSLQRLSADSMYQNRVETLIDVRKQKGKKLPMRKPQRTRGSGKQWTYPK